MSRRIATLSKYLFSSVLFSLTGILYFLFAFAFYLVVFDPRVRTADVDYYVLANGIFGVVVAFLSTLSVAARANRAENFPLLVRLNSRVEYLVAAIIAAFTFGTLIQGLVAILSLIANGPPLQPQQALEIVPIWISANILFIVLALHASDLVASNWSRVFIFGILAILLYVQSSIGSLGTWFGDMLGRLGQNMSAQGWESVASAVFRFSDWWLDPGPEAIRNVLGFVFWPFGATADAIIQGRFTLSSALAPAIFILYATILFLLASNFFARKDLYLSE